MGSQRLGYVESVNRTAEVHTAKWTGRMGRTGIDKRPVDGPVRLDGPGVDAERGSGIAGDTVADTNDHGGRHQAVYAYDSEELDYWSRELGMQLGPGRAGENLTLMGCASSDAVIGERWRVGDTVLRVTGPRTPCKVFAGFWDVPKLVKRFTEVGRTGAYLAVERVGSVRAGDRVEVLSRPEHGVRSAEVFAFRSQGRRELAERIAGAFDDMPPRWVAELRALM